jgi:hypothetical protein
MEDIPRELQKKPDNGDGDGHMKLILLVLGTLIASGAMAYQFYLRK